MAILEQDKSETPKSRLHSERSDASYTKRNSQAWGYETPWILTPQPFSPSASPQERLDRFERIEKSERLERNERVDRNDRIDRTDRSDRTDRADRTDRTDRTDRSDRIDRGDRGERSGRAERARRGSSASISFMLEDRPELRQLIAEDKDRCRFTEVTRSKWEERGNWE